MRVLLLVAFLVGVGSPAWGGFVDGNELHALCGKAPESSEGWACWYYVRGIVDATNESRQVCFAEGSKFDQVVDVVKAWLTNNPEDRHSPAHVLVVKALSDVWPCK